MGAKAARELDERTKGGQGEEGSLGLDMGV